MDELRYPADVHENANSKEIARVCITGDKLTVIVLADIWKNPAAWGIVLADLARHVAAALENRSDPELVLKNIRSAFDAEWSHPTK